MGLNTILGLRVFLSLLMVESSLCYFLFYFQKITKCITSITCKFRALCFYELNDMVLM